MEQVEIKPLIAESSTSESTTLVIGNPDIAITNSI
jgi:hypothetical protein